MSTTQHTFPSSSNPNNSYTVNVAGNGQMSCNCPGWTRRVQSDGSRSCKHTKAVEQDRSTIASSTVAPPAVTVKPVTMATMTGFVNPMLAEPLQAKVELVDGMWRLPEGALRAYQNGDWWMEEKYDGHRVIIAVGGEGYTAGDASSVRAWSRPRAGSNGVGLARTLPPQVIEVMRQMPWGTYDGELIVPGKNSWDVVDLSNQEALVLVLFDVLACASRSLLHLDAEERRTYLTAFDSVFTAKGVTCVKVAPIYPVYPEFVEGIWAKGGEGAILKRKGSLYHEGGRSAADWVKVKKVIPAVLTIVGFEAGKSGPHSTVLLRGMVVDHAGVTREVETSVKTLDNDWRRIFADHAAAYLGAELRIEHQGVFLSKGKWSLRHPMFDHMVKGELHKKPAAGKAAKKKGR